MSCSASTTQYAGILFDKDGTLIDFDATWREPCLAAADYLARQAGEPSRRGDLLILGGYDETSGRWQADSLLASGTPDEILDCWSDALGLKLTGRQRAAIDSLYDTALSQAVWVIDDRRWYESLTSAGFALGIATMDDERGVHELLDAKGIRHLFDFVCGGNSGYGHKPDPGMFNAFCRHCRLQAHQVIMVGDSPRDLRMGRNGGAGLVVGVLGGTSSEADLAPLADHLIGSIAELDTLPGLPPIAERMRS